MLTVLFLTFFVLLIVNMPIAFALGIAAATTLLVDDTLPINSIVTRAFVGVDSFTLLAIPFFIIAGELMNACGITERIVAFARSLVGHIRGGLAHVSIVSSMFFSGISGSATADASALGSMMIPAMKKNGFDADYAVAVNASSSAMGPIIPPSIMMVIYGSIANVSIAQLFLGGFVPGLMVALGLMGMAYYIARRRNYPAPSRSELPPVIPAFRGAAWALFMPVIILGGIFSGVFTATEAGVVAVAYAALVGTFVYKTLTFKLVGELLVDAAVTTAAAMFLIAMATSFAWLLAWAGFGAAVLDVLGGISTNPTIALLLILIFILILGLFIEGIPILIIFTPVLLPVILGLGIDPVFFGVILVMAVVIGSVTPPVGILTYICCAIAGITISQAFRGLVPFCAVLIAILLLCAVFPVFIMSVPTLLGH
ncbi:C4-dicarboxylate transporter, DctM subunit [Roseovarius azorensis]|uniref:TRAP transporter large permease protein n=1 Tax=Roseovarius azorensis TaxID=1287727 RepID=A0A1H7P1F3_9RHOB|nr:TRAP transporter large permease [Roseovarius azorensis]SEL29690.1 C4-dicarboxylate transporter, DctM subunit [Roseovarius azorensis]